MNTPVDSSARSIRFNVSTVSVGYFVYIFFQFAVLAALTRFTDAEAVGRWALAHTICTTLQTLTNAGLRQTKATDVAGRHAFADLLTLRVTSAAVSIPIAVLIAILLGADGLTVLVTAVFATTKIADCVVDLCHGLFQVKDRMDWLARSLIIRGLVSFCFFFAALIATGSLIIALTAQGIGWFAVLIAYELPCAARLERLRLGHARSRDGWKALTRLYINSLPIGISGLGVALQGSAPRFAVYQIAGLKVFGYLTVILYFYNAGLYVANSIGTASVARLAHYFQSGNARAYLLLLAKMLLLLTGVGICGMVGAWFLGPLVMRLAFGAEYVFLAPALVVLALAVTLRYLGIMSSDALLAQHRFRTILVVNAVMAILAFVLAYSLTAQAQLAGAVLSLAIVSGLYFLAMVVAVLFGVRTIND